MGKQVGAVLIFPEGITKQQVEKWLRDASSVAGEKAPEFGEMAIESSDVREFNPAHGGPIFYIP